MLTKDIMKQFDLSSEDVALIEEVNSNMQYFANLIGSDLFIDCYNKTSKEAIVVAESKPVGSPSLYSGSVIGEIASHENEPAVYTVLSTGIAVRDIRALTQESIIVRQDVIPIKNKENRVIAVLIREKDISDNIQREKKYKELIHTKEDLSEKLQKYNGHITPYSPSIEESKLAMKEIHHRVKNNLQYIASIMNMQARRSDEPEIKEVFIENKNRILSMASIHEILTQNGVYDKVSVKSIINGIIKNLNEFLSNDKNIDITIIGDDISIDSDKGTSIAIVVNELITNAVQHAFKDKSEGEIIVTINKGKVYSSITVEDNGFGFDPSNRKKASLGLSLIELTVKEKLGGKMQFLSDVSGSKISFDFKK